MIDILYSYNKNGPGKVISNLKKGLDLSGIPYNENPGDSKRGSKVISLQWNENVFKYNPENILIGPNVCTLPIDNHFVMSQNYRQIIVPSEWVKKLYCKWIPEEKILIWPVGIDTEYFNDKSNLNKELDCLIYYKRRNLENLNYVKKILKRFNQNFDIIEYGNYNEIDFIDKVSKSKYVFLLVNSESQGIAIQEMMSMNVPVFVWDVTHWTDRGEEFKVEASSVPYWDKRCGLYEINENSIPEKFNFFLQRLEFFNPRDYILENFSLKRKSLEIINIL